MVKIYISSFLCIICSIPYSIQQGSDYDKGKGSRSVNGVNSQQDKISKDWYKCDFESGYCGWKNDTTVEFQWERTSVPTPTSETGPRWDHTKAGVKGAGYYLFIETSVPRKNGDRARIISPILREKGPFCFRFWHNMHGSDVKDLNVIIKYPRSQRETTVSHLSGPWSVGSNNKRVKDEDVDWWNEESVDITVDEPINIIIEGISGKNYKGDIAIDDINLEWGACPLRKANCDFENDTCGWTQMAKDEFNWLPNRGKTQTLKTGPSHDHTLKTDRGRYLYIETSWPRVEGDKARLASPKILCDKGASPIFNFWYHMNGKSTGPLKVYVTNDKTRLGSVVWERTGHQGNRWFLGQIKINKAIFYKRFFYVIIEAEREDFEGDIAIDDVAVVGCRSGDVGFGDLTVLTTKLTTTTTARATTKPITRDGQSWMQSPTLPDKINCDFESKNLCGWQQLPNDDTDWTQHQNKTPSSHTGPASDHTTGRGWYIYFEASSPRKAGDFALIRSPTINGPIQACVSFYYHMRGKTMGTLDLLTVKRGSGRYAKQWMKTGQQSRNDTDWKFAQVTIRQSDPFHFLFRATRGAGFNSDIALDDIKVTAKPCSIRASTQSPKQDVPSPTPTVKAKHDVACDFSRSSICGWSQSRSRGDQFDWSIASQRMKKSNFTGPSDDHTSGSSVDYIYIDASVPNKKQGDSAKLISKSFAVNRPKCFRFWYHMYGAGIGNLTVYKRIKKKLIPLWENGGEKGNRWLEGMIDLDTSKQTVLVVEATRGPQWDGDIALDDFDVTDGKCPTVNCDFEVDNCGWTQEERNDQFNWTRHSGKTRSGNTGPSFDHTLKNDTGKYIYIEASGMQRYDKAWLRSPIIDPKFQAAKCLTFWYHSFGENVGSINVHAIPPNSNEAYLGSYLWNNAKNQGNQWVFAKVNIRETLPYQLLIQGTIGLDYLGDVAIDDIQLEDGPCEPCCDNNKFKCGNNFCIHRSQRCNTIDDCGDESDEFFCKTALQPECGMPHDSPTIRESTETTETIQRDEVVFETFVIPQENVAPTTADNSNETWKDAMRIPLGQTSRLKHPRLDLKAPIPIGYYSQDMTFSYGLGRISETINDVRKKRSLAKFIEDDGDDDWVDVLEIQESQKYLKMMNREPHTVSEHKYVQAKKEVLMQFGDGHKISDSDWNIMRGKSKKHKNNKRLKRSVKKIIGGTRTSRLNYPWQVAYYITDSSTNSHFFCGGTLFDRYWILTAAHCPYLGDLHNVVLGDYDLYIDEGSEQEMLVDAIFLRNKFKATKDMVGDIALIKLRYPAKQSKSVQLACLLKDDQEPFSTGHPCVTTGWGRRDSNTPGIERFLRQAEMPIVENAQCSAAFWSSFEIHDSYICAGGKGANSCKGDSGGPLVCKKEDGLFYLAGITSWGDARCTANIPGVFTRVQSFNAWIRRIMKKHGVCGSVQ